MMNPGTPWMTNFETSEALCESVVRWPYPLLAEAAHHKDFAALFQPCVSADVYLLACDRRRSNLFAQRRSLQATVAKQHLCYLVRPAGTSLSGWYVPPPEAEGQELFRVWEQPQRRGTRCERGRRARAIQPRSWWGRTGRARTTFFVPGPPFVLPRGQGDQGVGFDSVSLFVG